MQRLGLVLHISPSRKIVIKAENVPKIGETVVDENFKTIGEVFDIFGPVSSPYVAVRPKMQEPEELVRQRLYSLPSKRRKEKQKNERRRRT